MSFPVATLQCSRCGYKVESRDAIRCPRCCKLLFCGFCRGNCSTCMKAGKKYRKCGKT